MKKPLMKPRPRDLPVRATIAGLVVLLIAIGAPGCKGGDDRAHAAASSEATGEAVLGEAVFDVQGMHCASCPVTVRIAASRVDGVTEVRVSLEQGRAWVRYDARKTTPAKIALAITEAGYPASPANDQ